ncbi:hypothetical protein ACH4U7_46510 [Streptomyces sp. NPDC020845]|uniref:hypothetical protein n=1 Tax=Streptomyces sp. NPDC020845 TaxID=3365096 RepID=UPI0037B7B61F
MSAEERAPGLLGGTLRCGRQTGSAQNAADRGGGNPHRPHQARNQLPPDVHEQPAAAHSLSTGKVLRTRILGGLINEYRYAA